MVEASLAVGFSVFGMAMSLSVSRVASLQWRRGSPAGRTCSEVSAGIVSDPRGGAGGLCDETAVGSAMRCHRFVSAVLEADTG